MDNLKFVAGIIFTLAGIVLFILSLFFIFPIIYAIPSFIIGVALLLNLGREDKIEGIKKKKFKKNGV